jgi:hypothetical protein
MAQATGREQDCIDLYKTLENTHPSNSVKKQAANLRFIMEAPKLKLRPEERVSIPVLSTTDRFVCVHMLPSSNEHDFLLSKTARIG